MPAAMTLRACWALLVLAALTAVSSALALGGVVGDDPASVGRALVGAGGEPDPLVAAPARSHELAALRLVPLVPMGVAVVVAAAVVGRRRRPGVQGVHVRLVDVGDAWRALLLGAPPVLL